MSRARRIAWAVGVTAAAVVISAGLVRDMVLKSILVRSARAAIRGDVRLDRIQTGLFPPSIRLSGLSVGNPEGYPAGTAIRVDEFYLRVRRGAFRGPTNEIEEIRLVIPEISIISREDGSNNISDLMRSAPESISRVDPEQAPPAQVDIPMEPTDPGEVAPPSGTDSSGTPGVQGQIRERMSEVAGSKPFRIGQLTLGVGVLNLRSERGEGKDPRTQVIEIRGEHTLTDVTDLDEAQRELGSFMLMRAMPSLLREAMEER